MRDASNLPEWTRLRLSLQEYLRATLEQQLAERPSPEALIARIRERKARTASRLPPDKILRHRDAGRR
jgi:hypothetical protein